MSKAEDLLNSLSDEELMLYSTAVGEEGHIIISSDRTVTVPDELKKIAVQYDHNVETVTFDCPRYSDGVDMSEMAIYVNYMRPDGYKDAYPCNNIVVDETDPEIMHFDWTITRNATQVPGNLRFLVCVKKTDIEGNDVNHWNSDLCSDVRVGEGLECEEQIKQENPDTIAAILTRIDKLSEDKVDIPVPAKVGQVLSVKATDESGKPTEFEATDQGGGVSDEKIAEAVGTYMEANPIEETDPTVPDWAKQPEKPRYTALEVGADAAGTSESKVSEHNTSEASHNDIRLLVQGLTERLNALADSDDTTLDQMSEVVAYIKSNKSLIDAISTSKVNMSDIIDNLTTNVSNKPLSAAQGVKLKALIDAIVVPTKLSELENDSGYAKTTDIPDKLPNPQKLTFAGAVTAEYNGSGAVTVTIPESSGGSGGTVRIEKLSTDTAVELEPNKLYIFPEMSELTITLAEITDTSVASEYHFIFQSGATATTLSIPDTVNIPSSFSVDASKIYEVSILEGCLCAQSWAVS